MPNTQPIPVLRLSTTRLSLGLLVVAMASLGGTLYYANRVLLEQQQQQQHQSTATNSAASLLYTSKQKLRDLLEENKRLKSQLMAMTNQSATPDHNNLQQHRQTDTTCDEAFETSLSHQVPGVTQDSIRRSRANYGHAYRLDQVAARLWTARQQKRRPLQVVAFGGSITVAHGVVRNISSVGSDSYTGLLEQWLNDQYPVKDDDDEPATRQQQQQQHRVYNMAQHGADICSLAKRMTSLLDYLNRTQPNMHNGPDLILLEYAVNDYQGQDHVRHAVSQHDVFFEGFQDVALCAEVVVYKLLTSFPKAAVLFVEFRTAILQRKTAQLLHMGVAQHYQVPVISYADALFPEFFELVYDKLNASDMYTTTPNETLLPYPYGCHDCQPDSIIEQFRHSFHPPGIKKCRTVCDIMVYAGLPCDYQAPPPPGRHYCYPALFAVDAVHPSALGHQIAKDLIAHAIATAVKQHCQRQQQQSPPSIRPQVLPPVGWLGKPRALLSRSNFVMVHDADCLAKFCHRLKPSYKSAGFALTSDSVGFDKLGWIATNRSGGEIIEFDVNLPQRPCYAVYLAVLRSYWTGMGMMEVTVIDKTTKKETSVELDSLWAPKISVWSDNQITSDDMLSAGCTGQCLVRVRTLPQVTGRIGNKAKLLTLSVRECIQLF